MNDLLGLIAFVLVSFWNILDCMAAILIIEHINEKKKK